MSERQAQHDAPSGQVTAIFVTPKAGASMRSVSSVRAFANEGLEGDRYRAGEGFFSARGGAGRHLTLVETEALTEIAAESGLAITPDVSRRNIATVGIRVNELVGKRFAIGDVICQGVRLCEPCARIADVIGADQAATVKALTHRSGLRADILFSGTIHEGDLIHALEDSAPSSATETAPPLGATLDEARAERDRDHDATNSETTQPITPEELTDRIVPDDPHMSPDGQRVLFVARPLGRKEDRQRSAIWLGQVGHPARPFSAGTAHDHSPRWSPDGSRVCFLSDRAEKDQSQLLLMSAHGGEAQALGTLKGDLSHPTWSPDGMMIALLRKDPETAREKQRHEERDDAVVVGERLKRRRLWLINASDGAARQLTFGDRQIWSYCWLPDGERLAIVTTDSPELDELYGPADLSLVPTGGGVPRPITRFSRVPHDLVPVTLPEGLGIAARGNSARDAPSDSVWVVPLSGGQPRNLLAGYSGQVEKLVAAPNVMDWVAALVVEGVHGRAVSITLENGTVAPLASSDHDGCGSVQRGPSLAADAERVAYVWSRADHPEEVFVRSADGEPVALTDLGAKFHRRLGRREPVRWRSADDVEIEGLLVYPVGYQAGEHYPLIVEIHGGPAWQWEDRALLSWHDWAQFLASHGYAVLLPNPRGSTGYGNDFQRLLQDDVGGGECQDLITGADAMVARGIADRDRLGIGGWSWGGYLTAWTITQTPMFKAAVVGAGLANMVSDHGQNDIPRMNLDLYPGQPYDPKHLDHYWRTSPIRYVHQVTTPTLILHGESDDRVHPAQSMELHRALRTFDVPTQFVRYPREGHDISERLHQIDLLRRVLDWYNRWLM